jgi:hypothetical protein
MTTKADVTEFINDQWTRDAEKDAYWIEPINQYGTGTRLGAMQQWLDPNVARILVKLVGEVELVDLLAKNVGNK